MSCDRPRSRRYVPLIGHTTDALAASLFHAGATEIEVIDAMIEDRARLLDELAKCKEKSPWPVVFVMKQEEAKI